MKRLEYLVMRNASVAPLAYNTARPRSAMADDPRRFDNTCESQTRCYQEDHLLRLRV